jgi:energy-coupling factor transporter ATP-binding protein EcfA2
MEGKMVKVEEVPLVKISLPGLFGIEGSVYNRMIIVLTGPAGVGKTTLAHGMLHALHATERAAKKRNSPRVEVVPVHLLLEFNRIHSVEHDASCSISLVVGTSTSGVPVSLVTETANSVLKARKLPQGTIFMPAIVVDAATDLRGDKTDRLGNIWRGIQEFLEWMDRFRHYIVIFVAQERANVNAGPYAPKHRPGFPDSHLHSSHFLVRMSPAGEGKVRILTRAVNAIADKPQAEVSLTSDTLRALVSGGDSLCFGIELAGKTRVYVEA